jgi:hypothetical protein
VNLWLLGNKRKEGFAVGLAAQPIWLVFDWHVGAYGLMPLALVLGWLYVSGWMKWKRAEAIITIATDAPYGQPTPVSDHPQPSSASSMDSAIEVKQ